MPTDSIVDEVRGIREAIAREHGDKLDAIVEALRRHQTDNKTVVVSFPPRRLSAGDAKRKAG